MQRPPHATLGLIAAVLLAAGCDRNIEPAVPGEQPREPDLARIFPDSGDEPAAAPMGAAPAAQRGGAPATAQAGGATISGTISLAPEFEGRVPPGAVLFLVARPYGSKGGPPLAVQRLKPSSFPLAFEIGPADVMIPSMQFAGQIGLSARIDADGNAISRQPGDLQSDSGVPLAPGASGVSIVISESL